MKDVGIVIEGAGQEGGGRGDPPAGDNDDDNDYFCDNDDFGDYQIDWLLLEDEEGRQLRKMSEHLEPLREPLMVFIVFGIFMTVIIIVITQYQYL